ncbi:MAG: glycosyltransferase [Chthoniobacterales bacterium]
MIYLDVTSASQSALNTGVKRMQRQMHSWLSSRPDYQPVIWQSVLGRYRKTKASDLMFLDKPFEKKLSGLALYDYFLPRFPADLMGLVGDRGRLIGVPEKLHPDDILLVPDLIWDNRGSLFKTSNHQGARRIAVFHDAIPLKTPRNSKFDAFLCNMGLRALSKFDLVICISSHAEREMHHYLSELSLPHPPSVVVPWPVPFTHKQRPPHTSNFQKREILYVARLEKRKNHLRFLEACESLWRDGLTFSVRLIGCKSYPAFTQKLLSVIWSLQSAGRDLQWSAHISDEELHQAYEECSFTTFASLSEGFGLPILESLWHGRPVVCSNSGAMAEVARGGGCELTDVTDVVTLEASIQRLLVDEDYYNQLYGEIEVRTFRSWENYWGEMMSCLDGSISKKNVNGAHVNGEHNAAEGALILEHSEEV